MPRLRSSNIKGAMSVQRKTAEKSVERSSGRREVSSVKEGGRVLDPRTP